MIKNNQAYHEQNKHEQKETYPVQISISRIWHVIIDDNVDTLNVNSPTNQICGHKNPLVPLLETFVTRQPTSVNQIMNVHGGVQ